MRRCTQLCTWVLTPIVGLVQRVLFLDETSSWLYVLIFSFSFVCVGAHVCVCLHMCVGAHAHVPVEIGGGVQVSRSLALSLIPLKEKGKIKEGEA